MKLFDYIRSARTGSLLLLVWVIAVCLLPNVWLALTEHLSFFQALTNVLLPGALYILLMSITPKIGKASLWMIILFFFAAFQVVLLYMYGRSVIAVDMFLNVVTTNPGEVSELLGNMLPILLFIVLIYVPPIIIGIMARIKKWRLEPKVLFITRRTGLCVLAAGVLTFGLSFTSKRPYRPHCDLYPLNVTYNLYLAVERTVRTLNYHKTSAGYTHHARATHPDSVPELYVMVIGETSRADNWQLLGYDRPTTPDLMGRSGLVSFPRAISQSNTTHKSVPMLMSQLDATNFNDSIYYIKSIISAFKEAGFNTVFLSNQNRNHSFIDFFGSEADTCIFIKDYMAGGQKFSYDADMLPYLDRVMSARNPKQLVVLHCYGSHFNYIDRYPRDYARFTPDGPAKATHHYRDKQINAYDNTIYYTSSMLAKIIDRLKGFNGNTAMIYTSDHGEDIFDDDRRLFLHASPIPSYYQIHVPLLVWLGDSLRASDPAMVKALEANRGKYVATSRSYFHTLMDLAGIKSPVVDYEASVVSAGYKEPAPMYLNDHNEAVPLMECGILENDIENLHRLDIY